MIIPGIPGLCLLFLFPFPPPPLHDSPSLYGQEHLDSRVTDYVYM